MRIEGVAGEIRSKFGVARPCVEEIRWRGERDVVGMGVGVQWGAAMVCEG